MHDLRIFMSDAENIISLGLIILITFVVATIVRKVFKKHIEERLKAHDSDLTVYKFIRDLITLIIYLFGVGWALLTLPISANYAHTFFAGAGASTIILGIASQQVLGNIISGVYIVFTRPFKLNDIIEISGNKGKVVEINIHKTVLESIDTSSKIIIPNALVSSSIVINHSRKEKEKEREK